MAQKVLVLGLDGLDPKLITKWVERRKLPTFEKIIEQGCFGRLKSTIPPITVPAWPAMFSGKNPGKLGFFDFWKKAGKTEFEYVSSHLFKGQMIWDIISDEGMKTGVVDFPVTSPWKINGFMISGFTPQKLDRAYPPQLKEELISNVTRLPVQVESVSDHLRKETIFSNVKAKFELINYLLRNKDWDFFLSVVFAPDEMMHHTINEKDLFSIYYSIDRELSKILHFCKSMRCFLFIVSDHGCKLVHNHFYINKWLEKHRFIFVKKQEKSSFRSFLTGFAVFLSEKGLRAYLRFLARILEKATGKPLRPSRRSILDKIDWEKTRLYGYTTSASSFIGLWINQDRKISEKVVSDEKTVKKDMEIVSNKLKVLIDPDTGNKVIKNIYRRNELYTGPYISSLPNLIVETSEKYAVSSGTYPKVFGYAQAFVHDLFGVVFVYGPGLAEGKEIHNASIFDITPTILHLLDLPIPTDIDGRVLRRIYSKDSVFSRRPVKYREPREKHEEALELSEKEKEQIRKRLKTLGYID